MYPTVGSSVHIQSFKHDGSLHRTWCKGFVLEADEDRIVAVTDPVSYTHLDVYKRQPQYLVFIVYGVDY